MFIEERFPICISYGSSGGPNYSTRVIVAASGFEDRNINWTYPRHDYNAATGIKGYGDLELLIEFFHVAQGRAHGFRWVDDADDRSCSRLAAVAFDDQIIGVADGVETEFQLKKTYTVGSSSQERIITKPVAGSVLVGVDGVAQASGWTVDTTTGLVTFSTAPVSGNVTSGFMFDVPVRFMQDSLDISLEAYEAGTASVPIGEIRV